MEVFNKTRFKQAYQIAMSQQAPKIYKDLVANSTLKKHLGEIAGEAERMYEATVDRLRKTQGMGDEAKFIAAEIVFAEMIQFPNAEEADRSNFSWLCDQ